MAKLCNSMPWWSKFFISCFTLLGIDGGAGKGLTLAMMGRPYYKEDAIIKTFDFDGDIIDCIDIYKQPAFDHPLLKNHTIQMKPTSAPKSTIIYSEATTLNGSVVEDTHPWLFTKGCVEGSIPVTRMSYMNGLIVGNNNATASDSRIYHSRYLHKRNGIKNKKDDEDTLHEYSTLEFTGHGKLHGAKATFNVQLPRVDAPGEFSLAQIWVSSDDDTTILEAGWTVHPRLYHDHRTRLFTFWTNNKYGTRRCYNLQCPGFVLTNHAIRLDTALEPLSVYGGLQADVKLEIFQDTHNGDWWLRFRGQDVGYWPKSIVPKLGDGAHMHTFGGEVLNRGVSRRHTSTQMGSGHFAGEGFRKSAYIKEIQIVEAHDRSTYVSPAGGDIVATHPNCYDIHRGRQTGSEWGVHFYYGGPGRSSRCP